MRAPERDTAVEMLALYLAQFIRHELQDDPDHNGPEEAADTLAEDAIAELEVALRSGDWRDFLP